MLLLTQVAEPSSVALVGFAGSGTLTATSQTVTDAVTFAGSGTLTAAGSRVLTFDMVLNILDPELDQAPGVLTVSMTEGWPDATVEFLIDGTTVYTMDLDSEGDLAPQSIPVPDWVLAGTHTLAMVPVTNTTTTTGASGTFTVLADPDPVPTNIGPDADPVDVPAALLSTGVRRWVLQDLQPGGLGSYVFPRNPESAQPFPISRELEQKRTASPEGQFHISEPVDGVHTWSFSGRFDSKEFQDTLVAYAALNRRMYLIDHRNRAWTIAILGIDLVPRKRVMDPATGLFSDQFGQYAVRCLIYSRDYKTPV